MKKRKKNSVQTASISKKVLSRAQELSKEKVVNISDWRSSKIAAEDYRKTVISDDGLSKLDPAHGVYFYAQNQLSVFVEQLSELPELSRLTDDFAKTDEEYVKAILSSR